MAKRIKRPTGKAPIALLIGVGYTARALIAPLKRYGYHVVGTYRTVEKRATLKALGVSPVAYGGEDFMDYLGRANWCLNSIAPQENGDPFLRGLTQNFKAVAPHIDWAGYLSATSVYGHRDGGWVFEDDLLYPRTKRGRYRTFAELDWLESGAPVHIFRLAGIYGPELGGLARNPFTRLQNGTARKIIKSGHCVNRIHVKDIAQALMASLAQPNPVSIYNLADDMPAPPQDVLDYAAELLNVAPLPSIAYEEAELSDMARSFYQETKRVSNARAKSDLGWVPLYPSYREGLKAILKTGKIT